MLTEHSDRRVENSEDGTVTVCWIEKRVGRPDVEQAIHIFAPSAVETLESLFDSQRAALFRYPDLMMCVNMLGRELPTIEDATNWLVGHGFELAGKPTAAIAALDAALDKGGPLSVAPDVPPEIVHVVPASDLATPTAVPDAAYVQPVDPPPEPVYKYTAPPPHESPLLLTKYPGGRITLECTSCATDRIDDAGYTLITATMRCAHIDQVMADCWDSDPPLTLYECAKARGAKVVTSPIQSDTSDFKARTLAAIDADIQRWENLRAAENLGLRAGAPWAVDALRDLKETLFDER